MCIAALTFSLPAGADDAPTTGPGKSPSAGTNAVTVGIYINDLQNIDLAADTYTVDFYLWLRWTNPDIDPSTSIEAMNSSGTENTGGLVAKPIYPEPLTLSDGAKYQAVRFQGACSKKMNMETYPFDVQNLTLIFEDQNQDAGTIEYVPDTTDPASINPAVTNPGYEVGKPTLAVFDHKYPTNFGNTDAKQGTKYSRVVVTFPVKREVLPYLVKIMLPIFIVVLITSLIYVLPVRMEDARAAIGVTAMLTIVALQWTTDSYLPSVDYLTMLDLIYLVSLFYVFAAMAYTVVASRRNRQQSAEAVSTALDRRVGVISVLIYVVVMALTMYLYLHHRHVELLT